MLQPMNSMFGGFEELEQLAKAATSAFGEPFVNIPKITDKIDFPVDIFREKDGTFVIEAAVVGVKADQIKVTVKTENGRNTLTVKVNPIEMKEDEKKAFESRQYELRKIKKGAKLEINRLLPSNLDIRKTTKKVEDGLLTITIPVKEEEKPIEIEVE